MAAHTNLTIAQQQQILDLRKQGMTMDAIAEITKTSNCTVSRVCARGKTQEAYSPRYIKAAQKRKDIQAMIAQGLDYNEISKRVGYCRAYIVSLFGKDRNLKRKTRQGATMRLQSWCRICDEIIILESVNDAETYRPVIDLVQGWSYRIAECPRCHQSYSWDVLVNRAELERAWTNAFIAVDDE